MSTNRNQIVNGPDRLVFLSFGLSECLVPQFQPMAFIITGKGCGPGGPVPVWIKVEKIGINTGSTVSVPGQSWLFDGVWIEGRHAPIENQTKKSIRVHGEYNTHARSGWIEFDDMKVDCQMN